MATDEERLLVRLEANSQKLIKEMAKARAEVKKAVADIDGTVIRSNKRVSDNVAASGLAMQRTAKASGQMGAAIQNTAYQVGDFAVQVASGTAASRALAQQLPQLLGGLGVFGAVAGAAAAIALPLASNFFAASEELKKIDAISLDTVRSRISELSELQAAYNEAIRVSAFVQDEASARRVAALGTELQAREALFRIEVATLQQRKAQLEASVRAQREELEALKKQVPFLDDPAANAAEFTRTQAMSKQLEILEDIISANESKFLQLRKESAELDLVNVALDAAQGLLGGAVGLAGGLAANMGGAADEAGRFASNLAAGLEYGKLQNKGGGGPDAVRADASGWNDRPSAPQPTGAGRAAVAIRSGGRKGGGGGKAGTTDFLQQRLDAAQAAAEAARLEADSLLMGAEAATKAKIKFDLLQEAKRQNLKLDEKSAKTGLTLRESINRQADAIAELTIEAEKYREKAQFMDRMNQNLKDGFLDAIIEGRNFGEVLQNVAKQLARAALEAALFNTGPFSGGGRGGGIGLGGIIGGLFGGFRANGGDVSPGRAYVVGERQPELFVPKTAGTILPSVPKMGAGGQSAIMVALSPGLEAQILQKAQGQTIQIVRAGAEVQRRSFGANVDALQSRGAV